MEIPLCNHFINNTTFYLYGQKNVIITNLSTDFLINPDRVLKDGYPINIKLEDAVKEPENYQIIGIVKKNAGSGNIKKKKILFRKLIG